ncbi:aminoglycoside phosphotransferase family protein [Ilumatobacter sp.]|uniref:aminoglycoside phosphotransferase family protein n=1 Tax=Ilumatobacter sp. TaxID=1967498 RepID=UPI003F6D93D9
MSNMPAAEWEIDETLVRELLAAQVPELADRPLAMLANGWDNVMYRLGADLTVRLPRRKLAVPLIEHEQRCLELLAPQLPIPVPVPVHHGVPSERFPMPWSICPWFPGVLAADALFADPIREARRLGAFLTALHVAAPDDAPRNEWRGQDARVLAPRVAGNLVHIDLDGSTTVELVTSRFAALVDVDPHAGPPVWLHGDLHAANMLVDDGAISAVIDFGDITSGDPAVDLAIGWMLFEAEALEEFRRALPHADGATWSRGAAWALHFALMYLANSADNPRLNAMGRRLLPSVMSGELA